MSLIDGAWLVGGAVVGAVHVAGIGQSARHPTTTTVAVGMLRVAGVGLAMAAAAISGGVLPMAAGWGVGFFATAVVATTTGSRNLQRKAAP